MQHIHNRKETIPIKMLMTTIHVDIMTAFGDRYYDSFTFQHDPIFGKLMDELSEAFRTKFPTMAHRKDVLLCMDAEKTKPAFAH